MVRVHERIKLRRNELGMSVEDLASKINKNRTTIYRYEKGDIENLPLDVLEPLADALDTTPQYLMGWDTPTIVETKMMSADSEFIFNESTELMMNRVESWCREFGSEVFTEEEYGRIFDYTRFLIHLRETKKR